MHIDLPSCRIRDWKAGDEPALVRHANNRQIWMHLRDKFPHPYLDEHAGIFLKLMAEKQPRTVWAIEVDGEAAGGIGIEQLTDVERVSAEIGYWLGEAHWGKGVMTEALIAVTADVFQRFDVLRIFAMPFADNIGSIRVLEKAGYVLEGRLRHSSIKDGQIRDQLMFATYKPGL